MYALILAGGVGTRLWPRSRQDTPKQLLDLASEFTMLQETYTRLQPLVNDENIYIITNGRYSNVIHQQLPNVPFDNIIAEPRGLSTGPAVGLGILPILRRDPDAIVITLSADQLVQDVAEFTDVMRTAAELAEQNYLVTIGINPTRPDTGYGYIELDGSLATTSGLAAYKVKRFTEKPGLATAEAFIAGGNHLWNAGMFVWRAGTVMSAISIHLPALYQGLMKINAAHNSPNEQVLTEKIWQEQQAISIDFGVMEKANNVAVVPANLGWSDIGTWASLATVLPSDHNDNVILAPNFLSVDTKGTLVYSPKRLVATIGLQDMVIVDTEDALLVCPKDRAQDVKLLVDQLKQQQQEKYL